MKNHLHENYYRIAYVCSVHITEKIYDSKTLRDQTSLRTED